MLQIFTEHATELIEAVIPGYGLWISMSDSAGWPKDQYALIQDAEYAIAVWHDKCIANPFYGIDEDEIEDDDPDWIKYDQFSHVAAQIDNNWQTNDPISGWLFIEACKAVGYNHVEDGSRVAYWLANRIANMQK